MTHLFLAVIATVAIGVLCVHLYRSRQAAVDAAPPNGPRLDDIRLPFLDARYRPDNRPGVPALHPALRPRPREGRDPLVEPSPLLTGIPDGMALSEYICDGLVRIEIMLIQQARRPN